MAEKIEYKVENRFYWVEKRDTFYTLCCKEEGVETDVEIYGITLTDENEEILTFKNEKYVPSFILKLISLSLDTLKRIKDMIFVRNEKVYIIPLYIKVPKFDIIDGIVSNKEVVNKIFELTEGKRDKYFYVNLFDTIKRVSYIDQKVFDVGSEMEKEINKIIKERETFKLDYIEIFLSVLERNREKMYEAFRIYDEFVEALKRKYLLKSVNEK